MIVECISDPITSHIHLRTEELTFLLQSQLRRLSTKERTSTGTRYSLYSAFRCRIDAPYSSYSLLVIHMFLNVASDARIEPPIHVE